MKTKLGCKSDDMGLSDILEFYVESVCQEHPIFDFKDESNCFAWVLGL